MHTPKFSLKNTSNNYLNTLKNGVEYQHVQFFEIYNPDCWFFFFFLVLKTTYFLDLEILSKSNIMGSIYSEITNHRLLKSQTRELDPKLCYLMVMISLVTLLL